MQSASVGRSVRRRREELGLTQEVTAELAGVSAKFLRDVEHGKPSLQLDKLVAVLDALGLDLTVGVKSR